ncbi:YesL family protein [Streptococcus gallolyticus]|uniref:YesL family protein n=1 Tax=Streptococcus gallolyticus TaxID=315405 RepID=UPI0022850BAB|nr:DUF624 domain-containing protein [Streptococcus gallolyticus]MCY7165347.1 DUF624 domain-containing protein [Streptococcus gallolyticus subsp. gallolyticus]MCY7182446.1 DUF624 domain-containing protein [Streptococcus gallolyticus subsp. gallolyticus]MCY7184205.1 DUF624 domain-containing protein [Streptococcus gallolyticus subsp. gallolyticus]MCY7190437.1 DUF624 domain-containing protein [Streptococcus gallolyticus subsp. gallolyticus]
MKFDYNNRLFQAVTEICNFIALNLLFLITCFPIITIGPALSSLFYVTLRYADDKSGYLVKDYLIQLKSDLKNRFLISFIFLLAGALLSFLTLFWFSIQTTIGTIFAVICLALLLLLIVAFIICCALSGRYQNSLRQTLKNSFLLAIASPWHSIIILSIPVALLCLGVIMSSFKIFLVLFGASLSAYCSAFCLLSLFKKFEWR